MTGEEYEHIEFWKKEEDECFWLKYMLQTNEGLEFSGKYTTEDGRFWIEPEVGGEYTLRCCVRDANVIFEKVTGSLYELMKMRPKI